MIGQRNNMTKNKPTKTVFSSRACEIFIFAAASSNLVCLASYIRVVRVLRMVQNRTNIFISFKGITDTIKSLGQAFFFLKDKVRLKLAMGQNNLFKLRNTAGALSRSCELLFQSSQFL